MQAERGAGVNVGQLAHPPDELGDSVLIDGPLPVAGEQLVEVAIRIIAQAERVGIDAERGVVREVGPHAAHMDDFHALATHESEVAHGSEAKAANAISVGDALMSHKRGVKRVPMLMRG